MFNFEREVTLKLLWTLVPDLPHRTGATVQKVRMEESVTAFRKFMAAAVWRGDFDIVMETFVKMLEDVVQETGYSVVFPARWDQLDQIHTVCNEGVDLNLTIRSMAMIGEGMVLAICLQILMDDDSKRDCPENEVLVNQISNSAHHLSNTVFFQALSRRNGVLKRNCLSEELVQRAFRVCTRVSPPTSFLMFLEKQRPKTESAHYGERAFIERGLTENLRIVLFYLWRTSPELGLEFSVQSIEHSIPATPTSIHDRCMMGNEYRLDTIGVQSPNMENIDRWLIRSTSYIKRTSLPLHRSLMCYLGTQALSIFLNHTPKINDNWSKETLELAETLYDTVLTRVRVLDNPDFIYEYVFMSVVALAFPFDNPDCSGDEYNPKEFIQIWRQQVEFLTCDDSVRRWSAVRYFTYLSGIVWTGGQRVNGSRFKTVTRWLIELYPLLRDQVFVPQVDGTFKVFGSERSVACFCLFYSTFRSREFFEHQQLVLRNRPILAIQGLLNALTFALTCGNVVTHVFEMWEDTLIDILVDCASKIDLQSTVLCEDALILMQGLTLLVCSVRVSHMLKKNSVLRLVSAMVELMASPVDSLLDKIMEFMIIVFESSDGMGAANSESFLVDVHELISGLLTVQVPNMLTPRGDHNYDLSVQYLWKLLKLRLEAGSKLAAVHGRIGPHEHVRESKLRAAVMRCLVTTEPHTVMLAVECMRTLRTDMGLDIFEYPSELETAENTMDYDLFSVIVQAQSSQLSSVALIQKQLCAHLVTVASPSRSLRLFHGSLIKAHNIAKDKLINNPRPDIPSQRYVLLLMKVLFAMVPISLRGTASMRQQGFDRFTSLFQFVLSPVAVLQELAFSVMSMRLNYESDTWIELIAAAEQLLVPNLAHRPEMATVMGRRATLVGMSRLSGVIDSAVDALGKAATPILLETDVPRIACVILSISQPILQEAHDLIPACGERLFHFIQSVSQNDALYPTQKSECMASMFTSTLRLIRMLTQEAPSEVAELSTAISRALSALTENFVIDMPDAGKPTAEIYKRFVGYVCQLQDFADEVRTLTDSDSGTNASACGVASSAIKLEVSMTNLLRSNIELAFILLQDRSFLDNRRLRKSLYAAFSATFAEDSTQAAHMAFKYGKLGDYLMERPAVIFAMCDICPPEEGDSLASSLVQFAEGRGQSLELVKAAVNHELSTVRDGDDLFRQNSVTTKLIMAFVINKSRQMRVRLLSPFVQNAIRMRFSVVRTSGGSDVSLAAASKDLINNVLTGHETDVRFVLRVFLRYLYDTVNKKFPGAGMNALSNVVMLRCICASIVSPERYDLMERAPTGVASRMLIALANTLQKLTGPHSADSELRDSFYAMMHRTIDVQETDEPYIPDAVPDIDRVNHAVHQYLYRRGREVRNVFLARSRTICSDADRATVAEEAAAIEEFSEIFKLLGRPLPVALLQPRDRRRQSRNQSITEASLSAVPTKTTTPKPSGDMCTLYGSGTYKGVPVYVSSGDSREATFLNLRVLKYRYGQYLRQNLEKTKSLVHGQVYDFTTPVITPEQFVDYFMAFAQTLTEETVEACRYILVFNAPYSYLKVIFNTPGCFATRPHARYDIKTALDMDTTVLQDELRLGEETLDIAKDIKDATLYDQVPAIIKDETVMVDVYVGRDYVHFTAQVGDAKSCESFAYTRVHLDSDSYRIRLQTSQGTFTSLVIIEQHQQLYRKIRAMKTRPAIRKNKSSVFPGISTQPSGVLLFTILVDLCRGDKPIWLAAHELFSGFVEVFGINVGPRQITGIPFGLVDRQVDSIVAVSTTVARSHFDLTYCILRMFIEMLNSALPTDDLRPAARIAAPWFANLKGDGQGITGEAEEVVLSLLKTTIANDDVRDVLLNHFWAHIETTDTITRLLLELAIKAMVDRRLRNESVHEKFLPALASCLTPSAVEFLFERLRTIMVVDVNYTITTWTDHHDWVEIEVLVLLLSYIRVDSHASMKRSMPQFFFLFLSLTGVGSYELRKALHRIFLNLVDSFLTAPNLDPAARRRLKTVWSELHLPRIRLLFGVQEEVKDWTFSDLTEFTWNQSEQMMKMALELFASETQSFHEFNTLREETHQLLLRYLHVTFPALQRRCIYGLVAVNRFHTPDDVIDNLLGVLRKALTQCHDMKTAMVYLNSVTLALSRLVEGLDDKSRYLAPIKYFATGLCSLRLLPLYPEALSFLTTYINQANYRELFLHKKFRETESLAAQAKVAEWWREHQPLLGPPAQPENFVLCITQVLAGGLQNTDSQMASIAACENMFNECSRLHNAGINRQPLNHCMAYMLLLYLSCQDLGRLQNVPWVTKVVPIIDDESFMDTLAAKIASFLTRDNHLLIVALVQACYVTGHSTSMNFMHAGPRLIELMCHISDEEVLRMVCPLLRTTITRLLELEDPVLNSQVVAWSLKLFRPPEDMVKYRTKLQEIIASMHFPPMVNDHFKLIRNDPPRELTPEICEAIASLIGVFLD